MVLVAWLLFTAAGFFTLAALVERHVPDKAWEALYQRVVGRRP